MAILDRPRPIRRATKAIAVVAALAATSLVVVLPVGAADALLDLTLSKTTAISNADSGDQIQVSGTGCTEAVGNLINVSLFPGAFGPADTPPINNVVASGYSPTASGDWSGSFPIPPIPGLSSTPLAPGQYTIRAACIVSGSGTPAFFYANAVITITDGSVPITNPPGTSVEPTPAPGQPVTSAASPASPAAVAVRPAYTG